jgi:hypothetical protein
MGKSGAVKREITSCHSKTRDVFLLGIDLRTTTKPGELTLVTMKSGELTSLYNEIRRV